MVQQSSSLPYAVIDLGSNSFHMLIVRHVSGCIQTLAKIKRKVRLAAGLDAQHVLNLDAMQRGWDCLSLFAERLQDIPTDHIRIVGTATLRAATNADVFLQKAHQILGHPIDVISGEEEAATIYTGVAHTSGGIGRRLVVDIGGASTEIIIGEGFEAKALTSLPMGCVTWLERHFKDRQLTSHNFEQAIQAAKDTICPILQEYRALGWNVCVGASGTVQALQEIMLAQGMDETITLSKLKRLKKQAMLSDHLEELEIEGLTLERALVFPSGLSILIAIFETFSIESMTLAGGALREGLAYGMIQALCQDDIQQRTIQSLQHRYHLDTLYGEQVANLSSKLFNLCGASDWIPEQQAEALLRAAAQLHEIGLSIDFKRGGEHGAYLIQHSDLPGFTHAQRSYIGELIRRYRDGFNTWPQQHALSDTSSKRLLRIFRLSIILSHRRAVQFEPIFTLSAQEDTLTLTLDEDWLAQNPLTKAELEIESNRQSDMGWPLMIQTEKFI